MEYFSEEYRNKLVAEHKLISASIIRFTENYKQYATHHGVDAMTAAHTELRAHKVLLELKIDLLRDYLNS